MIDGNLNKTITPVILLIGGKGSRYLDDNNSPKQLAVVKKKPILIQMMNAYFENGFNFIILPLGYKKKFFRNFFKDKKNLEKYRLNILKKKQSKLKSNMINILLFDTKNDLSKLERVKKSINFIKNFNNIGVNYGDAICDININSVFKKFIKEKLCAIMSITIMKSPFGHVKLHKNIIKEFIEKPDLPSPTNIGYYFFKVKAVMEHKIKNSELETTFFQNLIKSKKLGFYLHKGYFHTVNHKQDLINIKRIEKKINR